MSAQHKTVCKCVLIYLILSGHGACLSNCRAAIIFPAAPENGEQIVHDHVGPLLRSNLNTVSSFQINDLEIMDPHREYQVALTQLASGHLLSAVRTYGWRYLLVHDSKAVGEAELWTGVNGIDPPKFNSLSGGPFANDTLYALRYAQTLDRVKRHDYEMRYLEIPGVWLVAVWLHRQNDDIIIQLTTKTNGPLKAFHAYSEREIIQTLRMPAQRCLELESHGDG